MTILLKNAKISRENGLEEAEIFIEDEKIKKIGKNLNLKADIEIDCKDKLVVPAGVDAHTHMCLDLGQFVAIDDFYSGSLAASFGATTSIVDHIGDLGKGSSLTEMIDHYHDLADGNAVIDYSFHGAFYEVNNSLLDEMKDLYDDGIVSMKIYTTYGGKLDDDEILRVLKRAKETNTVICVHCENDGAIKELREEAIKNKDISPIFHAKTRPVQTEAEAINRLIYLSEIAGFPKLYIVHTSSKEGLDEIKKARERGVKNLYCETCTQYLTLDESKYLEEDGEKYIMSPPLRTKEDVEALWQGIKDGVVDVIATDHCPFYLEEKELGKNDFTKAPGGAPGVEERMEVILTEGLKRGIPLKTLTELLSTNPAKIFGLSYKKGAIKEGLDADIAIFSKKQYVISEDNRHSKCDYTSYEGFVSDFMLDKLVFRGRIIIDKGNFLGNKGDGKFIARKFKE